MIDALSITAAFFADFLLIPQLFLVTRKRLWPSVSVLAAALSLGAVLAGEMRVSNVLFSKSACWTTLCYRPAARNKGGAFIFQELLLDHSRLPSCGQKQRRDRHFPTAPAGPIWATNLRTETEAEPLFSNSSCWTTLCYCPAARNRGGTIIFQ